MVLRDGAILCTETIMHLSALNQADRFFYVRAGTRGASACTATRESVSQPDLEDTTSYVLSEEDDTYWHTSGSEFCKCVAVGMLQRGLWLFLKRMTRTGVPWELIL